ncbi:E3 ubiquitin-protein ligase RNF31-like [Branchiostoma lanceolatum]|uniref:E3 ubiquitin-protein ligase RNF31-like n=1 Tax=Branchiostoma lanceolatum TaxID=7740 RepID=UPI003456BF18
MDETDSQRHQVETSHIDNDSESPTRHAHHDSRSSAIEALRRMSDHFYRQLPTDQMVEAEASTEDQESSQMTGNTGTSATNRRHLTPRGTSDKDSKSEERESTEQQLTPSQLDENRRIEELQGGKTKLRSEIRSMFEQIGTLSIAVFHPIVVLIIQKSLSLQERYTHVDFDTLLRDNCTERPQKVLDLLAAVTILEKYSRNLLKPVRPAFWRIVKFSNGIFKTKVDIIQGSRPVLQKLGYTIYAQDGLAFPEDQPEPDVVRVVEIAADLIQARLELEMIICGTHPQPDTMYIFIPREIFQQAEQLAKDQYYQRQREQASSLAYSVETKAPLLQVTAQTESSGASSEPPTEQLLQNAPGSLSHSVNGAEQQMQLQSQEQQLAVAPATAAEVMYCKVCEEPATEWCRSCEAAHCRTCDAQLHKHKTRRTHERVPIAQMHEPPGEQESQSPANQLRSLPLRTTSPPQVATVAPNVQSGMSLGGQPLDVASGVKPSQSLGPQPARTMPITSAAAPQAAVHAGPPIPDMNRRVMKFEIEIAKYRVEIEEINERQSKFLEATPEFVELEKKRQELLKQKAMVEEALRQLTGTERRMQMERQQQQQQQQQQQAYMTQSQQHAAIPTGLPDALGPALPQGVYPQAVNFAQGQGQFHQPQGQRPNPYPQQQQWQNFGQNMAMWGQQQRAPIRQPYTLQYRHPPPQEFQAPSRPQISFSEITCTRCTHSNPIINISCEICNAKLPLIDTRLLQQDSRFLPEPRPSMRELGLPEVLKPPPAMEYKPAQSPKVPGTAAASQKSKQTPYRADAVPSQKAGDIIRRPPMEQPIAGLVQPNVGQTVTTSAASNLETQRQSTSSPANKSQVEVIKPPSPPLVSSQTSTSRTLSPAKTKGFSRKWHCEVCTFINEPGTRICAVCDKTSDNPQFIQGGPEEQIHELSVAGESVRNVKESLSHLSLEGISTSGAPSGKRPETMGGDLTPVDTITLPGAGADVNTQKVPGGTVVEIQDQIWREKQLAKREDEARQRSSLSPAPLVSKPPDIAAQRQQITDIPDSPPAERQPDLSSLGQQGEVERRPMNLKELQERKRQEDMRTEGLQMIKWFREAEHAGFLPEEVQAALFHCGNGNPVSWLKENWQELVASVAAQATEEGKKLKINIVGVITTQEATEALRKQEGDIPKSIKECIDCRRKKFIYVMEYQEFEQDQVLRALQENSGDTEKAILAIQRDLLQPFEEHIFKEDENHNRVELKEGDFERNVRMLLCQFNLPSWGRAEQAVKLIESGEYNDYDFEDIIEAVRSCLGLESCKKYLRHECQVCTDVLPQHKLLVLTHCSCEVCVSCMKQYFTITIRDKNIKDMVCPVCSQPDLDDDEDAESEFFNLLDIMLKNILDDEVHELFQQKLRDRTLMRLPNFRWCSNCSSGMINDQPEQRLRMMCADCGTSTCYKCKKPWEDQHENITCEEFQAWKELNDPEFQAAGLAAILNDCGIDCPNCKFRYALAKGGCMHFKCVQCKHEFCSGCYNTFRHNCTRFSSCARKGLHAHHPRDCLFYMRDRDPIQLQRLLQDNGVEFDTEPPAAAQQAGEGDNEDRHRCKVMEQKETNDGLQDDFCGLEAPAGYAGLCRLHYNEYLVGLINTHKIDPVVIMDSDELRALLLREEQQVPQPHRREGERAFWQKLVQEVQQRLPLPPQPPRERHHT